MRGRGTEVVCDSGRVEGGVGRTVRLVVFFLNDRGGGEGSPSRASPPLQHFYVILRYGEGSPLRSATSAGFGLLRSGLPTIEPRLPPIPTIPPRRGGGSPIAGRSEHYRREEDVKSSLL